MSDIITFILELKDQMSGGIRQAGATTHSVFGGMDKDIHNTTSGIHGAASAVSNLKEQMQGLSEMKMIGGMAVGELLARGVEEAGHMALEQIKSVFEAGLDASKIKAQLNVLAGDLKGNELYESIHDYIPTSLFGPELFNNAKMMMSLGVATENILPNIKMLGDISMGDSEKMAELSRSLGLVSMSGHLTGREVMMMTMQGFNPLLEISRTTGISMGNLAKLMEKGGITTHMVTDAFKSATSEGGRFFEMQKKMAETPFGKMKIMETNIDQAKEEFGLAMLPVLTEVIEEFKPIVANLPAIFEQMRPSIEGVVHDIADMVKWVANNTDTLITWFGYVKKGVELYIVWKGVMFGYNAGLQLYNIYTAAAAVKTAYFATTEEIAAAAGTELAAATAEAAVATEALNAAMTITPWGAIAAGIGLVASAYVLLGNSTNDLHNENIGDMSTPLTPEQQADYDKGYREWMKQNAPKKNGMVHMEGVHIPASAGNNWQAQDIPGYDYNQKEEAAREKKKNEAADKSTAVTDAIVGGGQKQIIIHAKFVEHWDQHISSMKEGAAQAKDVFEKMFNEVLESAKASL